MWNEISWEYVWQATQETFYMVGISTVFTALLGIPLGVLLVVLDKGYFWESVRIQRILGAVVNFFRAVPFVVLVLLLFPVSEYLFQTSLGPTGAILPLIVGAAPFYARMVETAIREIPKGVIEAAESMGASRLTIIGKVLIPEALPAIVSGLTVTCVSLISFSAMTGLVGAGGLGDAAYRYGFQSFNDGMMIVCSAILVLLVQIIQGLGDWLTRRLDKR